MQALEERQENVFPRVPGKIEFHEETAPAKPEVGIFDLLNAVNGILGVQTGAGANTLGFASNIVCSSNLPDKIASAVDTQIDDGVMQTGLVRSSGPQATPSPALAALPGGTTTYVENGTNQYTICKQL